MSSRARTRSAPSSSSPSSATSPPPAPPPPPWPRTTPATTRCTGRSRALLPAGIGDIEAPARDRTGRPLPQAQVVAGAQGAGEQGRQGGGDSDVGERERRGEAALAAQQVQRP